MEGILPLDPTVQRVSRAVASQLAPRRQEIADRWSNAYLSSPVRETVISDEQVRALIGRLVDLFIDNITRGDFEGYFNGLADAGHEYAMLGISYANLLLAIHLYEEVVDPIVAEEYADRRELVDALLALDHLNHNALAVMASSYFGVILGEIRERNRQLAVINSVANTVSQSLDLQQVLESALDRVVEELGYDYAEILLLDESEGRLYPRAYRGLTTEIATERESFRVGEGLPGIVAQTGQPLFLRDLEHDSRFLRKLVRLQGLRSGLGIPLISRNKVVGAMDIFSRGSEPPAESELDLLKAVGSEIGVAIENATLYRRLRERAEELAEANRRREQFISLVAHEFRGPLTVIIGYGEMLARTEAKKAGGGQQITETMVSQAKRLARLVDDLQDVSQIETGRFQIVRERFDLVGLARETAAAQQQTTRQHEIRLRAPSHPVEVNWDRDRIAQVLVNLLTNAVKYSPEGGRVTLSIGPKDDEVEISVTDEGVGIDRKDFPQLFRPYSQLYGRRKAKGSGLGLFITLGIVQAHGGSIWVESQPGKGTTFHLEIPKEPPERPIEMRQ